MCIRDRIVGFSTRQLAKLNEGDEITDFVGPLGVPTDLHKSNHVVGIAGGVGSAPLYPQLKKLAEMGVDVDVICLLYTSWKVKMIRILKEMRMNVHV